MAASKEAPQKLKRTKIRTKAHDPPLSLEMVDPTPRMNTSAARSRGALPDDVPHWRLYAPQGSSGLVRDLRPKALAERKHTLGARRAPTVCL